MQEKRVDSTDLNRSISVDWASGRIRAQNAVKEGNELGIVGLLIKLEVHHKFQKMFEGGGTEAAEHFWRSCHLLLTNQKALVVSLLI